MAVIEKMAEAFRKMFKYPDGFHILIKERMEYLQKVIENQDDFLIDAVGAAKHDIAIFERIIAYESEKELLAKTQEWHGHGKYAPSCVGCPTAEMEIASDNFVRVRKDRLKTALSGDCPYHRGVDVPVYCEKYDEDCVKCVTAYITGAD